MRRVKRNQQFCAAKIMTDHPLSGWRITITRAKDQSGQLSNQLTHLGAVINECPMIEIAPPSSWESLDSGIEKLDTYNWLIFTSGNAVDYFFKRLNDRKPDRLPPHLQVCAVGWSTASKLNNLGIAVDLVPRSNSAEGILDSLTEAIGRDKLPGNKFLFPRAKFGRDYLVNELRERGTEIDLVEAYQTIRPECDKAQISALLKQQTDIIVFTSPSTVRNLADLVGDQLRLLLKDVAVACIGPTTRQVAIEKELSVVVEPAKQTTQDLVDSIINFAKNR